MTIFLEAITVYLLLGATLVTILESLRFFPRAQVWVFGETMPPISPRGFVQTVIAWPVPLFFLLVIITAGRER